MRTLGGYLICLILLFCGAAFAQDDSSFQKARDLCVEGDKAFGDKNYRKAIEAYLEATSYPEVKDWRLSLFYAVSSGYSLLGEAEKAFEYLDSAVEAGYTDYRRMNVDQHLRYLRENHGERFEGVLGRVKSAKADEIGRKSPVYVVEYDNYSGPLEVSEYDWEDINRPEMDTLRNRYQLRRVIGSDGTEFDKMKRLLNWVATRWVHDGSKMAPERTALAILREVEEGKRFCCANYADVLIGCMRCLGYPIRFVGLKTEDAAYNMGGGHGCVEVWSNQYQKWILLDVQNNAWWEHTAIPLSAYECHRLFTDGSEDELNFVGQHEGHDYARAKSTWSAHFFHVINYWMGDNVQLVSDAVTPELLYQLNPQNHEITDQYDKAYPRLNQTTITLRNDQAGSLDSMTVILAHTLPYFDRFLVRIDEEEWKEAADTFQWGLNDGMNVIEAKAVNVTGIEGRTSRVTLQSNLGHSD
jgi:hypothetical protein